MYLVAEYMHTSAPKARGRWVRKEKKEKKSVQEKQPGSRSRAGSAHKDNSYLEVCRHEGVVDDHHDVFVVLVANVRAGLDVDDLHGGIRGSLDPHQLHRRTPASC